MPTMIKDCKCGANAWVERQTHGWMVGCKSFGDCQFTLQDVWAETKEAVIERWNEDNPVEVNHADND